MAKMSEDKVAKVMHEYKMGTLHSGRPGKGKKKRVVKNRKQAIAIALSEARSEALKRMGK